MSYDYSENVLVRDGAGEVLAELGWDVQLAYDSEKLGKDGTYGRESYRDVLLYGRVEKALKKFNPWLTKD